MSLMVQPYFTHSGAMLHGTHSRCLRNWEQPLVEMDGFFHIVKVIDTNRVPKNEGEQEKIIFFYDKLTSLGWDPNRWRWFDGEYFLNFTTKDVTSLSIRAQVPPMRAISDKVTYPITTSFTGCKFGTCSEQAKKPFLCGRFGTKRLSLMCGGPLLRRPPFSSNVCFVSPILVSPLSINFGVASKLEGFGVGLLASCTKFAGFGWGITAILIGNKRCSENGFLNSLAK